MVLMLPAGLASSDVVFRTYNVVNIALFWIVVVQVARFRRSASDDLVRDCGTLVRGRKLIDAALRRSRSRS